MSDSMIYEKIQVLIACEDTRIATRFTDILDSTYVLTSTATWKRSMESITRHQQSLLILDPAFIRQSPADAIAAITTTSPDTRIIILETSPGPEIDQVALFKLGVHGFFHSDIPPELLIKAADSVCKGELWMQRSLITRVIDELARNRSPATGDFTLSGDKNVECLTPRELEVARMVHQGGNNKNIARTLDISERTVKAHLSAIFRKLDIDNRLHLAIYFNDVSLHSTRH